MGDDAHTRDGGGYVAGVATDERLGQHPRAEAATADTRTPASRQGVNLATVAKPGKGGFVEKMRGGEAFCLPGGLLKTLR